MIKKLRIRITVVIMVGLTVLITAVVSGIYIFMQRSEAEETDKVVNSAVSALNREDSDKKDKEKTQPPESSDPSKRIEPGSQRERRSSLSSRSWISVLISSDGKAKEVKYSNPYSKPDSDDEISEAAEAIVSRNSDEGYVRISDVSYRYFIRSSGSRTRALFIDRTNQLETMQRLLFVLIAVGIGTLILLFPISVVISGWIVKPISKAWKSQKEFFANASHELKTPLTVISANLDVITSEPDKTAAEQEKWFEYIKTETVRMSKLITQMLYLSKEDREDTGITMTELDASGLFEGVCLSIEALAFENGHELVTDIEPGITAKGDRETIIRLANILIDNAISHSLPGGGVRVSFHRNKNKFVFSVTNKGEYIPPEELSRLFDRFYRTDKSRNKDTGGFGLGLSIAKAIAEKHRGTLNASCAADGTTTFTFTWHNF